MVGSLRMAWTSGSWRAAFLLASGSSCLIHRCRPVLASFGGRRKGREREGDRDDEGGVGGGVGDKGGLGKSGD